MSTQFVPRCSSICLLVAVFSSFACAPASESPSGSGPSTYPTGTGGTTMGSGATGATPGVGGGTSTGGTGAMVGVTGGTGAALATGGVGVGGDTMATGGTTQMDPNYPPPPRELAIDVGRGPQDIQFSPTDADPAATSFHGNAQVGSFDPTAPTIQKKLILKLGGINSGAGGFGWGKDRGYHVLGVDYWNEAPQGEQTEYLETWSGEDLSTNANIGPSNSIMNRVKTGLAYLDTIDPGADWAYYLDTEGNVRWNDVIIFAYSYGGQTAVAATKYVPLHRIIITSSPNVNPEAAWLQQPPVTPVERCVVISGVNDGEHDTHMAQTEALGWPGDVLNVTTLMPPYDSNRLEVNDGHSDFCGRPFADGMIDWDSICEGAFGLR